MGKTLKRQRAREAAEAAGLRPAKRGGGAAAAAAAAAASAAAPNASKLTFLASQALQARDWPAALKHLAAMRAAGKPPKLGAVQRWVRDADSAGDERVAAQLICAVLRAADAGKAPAGGTTADAAAVASAKGQPPVRRFPPWLPPDPTPPETAQPAAAAAGTPPAAAGPTSPSPPAAAPAFHEIPRAPGAGGADSFVTGAPVPIFAYPPGAAVTYDSSHPPARRAEVPSIPGAFVLVGALGGGECRQLLRAGRALGFTREVDYSFGGGNDANGSGISLFDVQQASSGAAAAAGAVTASAAAAAAASAARAAAAKEAGLPPVAGRPAEGCVWMVDDSVLAPLYRRIEGLLPRELGGGRLAGINPRWRLYRYTPGAVYRPHGALVPTQLACFDWGIGHSLWS
jgi:hypothetical protein